MTILKPVDRTIGTRKVTIVPFPPIQAVRMSVRMGALLGPSFANLIRGIDFKSLIAGGAKDRDALAARIDLAKILPEAIITLAERLKPEDFASLCVDLLGLTRIDGVALDSQAHIDAVFAGDLGGLFETLYAVLEANRFFALGAFGSLLGMGKAPGTTSPAPSTQS